jgi:hypothetical protein
MRVLLIASCLAVNIGAVPARAEWQVHTHVDKMTDRTETYVTLDPIAPTSANLQVSCFPSMVGMPAHLTAEIVFTDAIGVYEVGTSHRFDEGPIQHRITRISTDGRSLWLWSGGTSDAITAIRRAKRLRVSVKTLFLDFALAGSDAAINKIRCK